MMSSLKCPLYKSLYSTITFKKVMVVVCGVLLMINSVGTVVAGNPFFNQTIRAATTPSGANQPLINQQLYGFDGQLTDPESGYQFLGRGYHRAYNPVTRRFMSQDSMSPFSKGGFNGYIFARNNPIMHQDPSGHMSTNFWINIGAILGAIVGAVLAPFTGGSTAVIAAGEVAAAAGATSGALGAAGAATHNKALQKASLGLGIAGAAIDAVNIIGSGAKLVASSADAGVTAASDGSKISTTVGGGAAKIADGEDIPMQEISACFTARTAIATNKVSQHKNIKEIGLGENVLTTSPQTKKSNIATPSYDLIPIMPKTWEEVDLSYHDIIDGKSYPASIKLLRPVAWLKSHGMHNLGSNVTLSIPEFGINAIYTQVTAIKPTTLNTANVDWSKHGTRPVIGKFKRYAPIAKTYMFKNLTTGKVSTVNATPNHPFYVKNKKAFVPIQDVSSSDQLISATGQKIELVCLSGKITHCGIQYKYGRPAPVYNLEVYRKHVYFVGKNELLVHNVYPTPDDIRTYVIQNDLGKVVNSGEISNDNSIYLQTYSDPNLNRGHTAIYRVNESTGDVYSIQLQVTSETNEQDGLYTIHTKPETIPNEFTNFIFGGRNPIDKLKYFSENYIDSVMRLDINFEKLQDSANIISEKIQSNPNLTWPSSVNCRSYIQDVLEQYRLQP